MKFNQLEAAKSELQSRNLNLPQDFEERELNEKEATKFNRYVVIDTSITSAGRSQKQVTHLSLQAFDVMRLLKPSVKAIVDSGDAILIHDMNKKAETPKPSTSGRGRKKKEDTNETDV